MSDLIKFGPEWLRNMSSDTGNVSSASNAAASGGAGNTSYSSMYTLYIASVEYFSAELLPNYLRFDKKKKVFSVSGMAKNHIKIRCI